MKIKVSDYIVDFLIKKGITDVFGYPGGMVTHLMESFRQREGFIKAHINYHEQAAAFCACGYAQICDRPGVAYATSGPGATNLVTGICNAYFDSIPAIFITGQVNTFECKKDLNVRQKGFQETDIISMVKEVTKYCSYVEDASNIKRELEKAWHIANENRKGPVLLDIPMNVFSSVVETDETSEYIIEKKKETSVPLNEMERLLKSAKRPVLLLGAGTKCSDIREMVFKFIEKYPMPVVSSMLAIDVLSYNNKYNYGFIGAYGVRTANFIVAKCDLLISVASRLDVRQIGAKKENFAPNAKLIRIEADAGELSNKIKDDELQINCDARNFFQKLLNYNLQLNRNVEWLRICDKIKSLLDGKDIKKPNVLIKSISDEIPDNTVITTDVGQNQVWIAQSFCIKENQKVLFSGGHGAMGYSLPAAIGAHYAGGRKVISFNGDGGIQMNIQELQFIVREKLPITIIIMNNKSLGMIRHFQEMYFEGNYYQTVSQAGYDAPDFSKVAEAYGIEYSRIEDETDIGRINWNSNFPKIIEVILNEETYVFPKLEFGKPNQDQEPLIDRKLFQDIMEL